MKLEDSAPERNASPEEALAYSNADTVGLICFVCSKRLYEQEGQDSEVQICECIYEFYNVFI